MKRTISLLLAFVLVLGIFCYVPITELPLGVTAEAASVDDLTFKYRWLSDLVGGYFWQDENAYAVSGCNKSASGELVIPSTYNGKPVMEIGENAFEDCTSLKSITIPNSVTEIGSAAFRNCTGLTSVTIPDSVIEIGDSNFYGCSKLTAINVATDNKNYASVDGVS